MSVETGLVVTGLLAAIYGVGFAFAPKVVDWPRYERPYVLGGSVLVLLAAVFLVIMPWMGTR